MIIHITTKKKKKKKTSFFLPSLTYGRELSQHSIHFQFLISPFYILLSVLELIRGDPVLTESQGPHHNAINHSFFD
ncbi:hypothetical protein HanHA89_Chr13g0507371 [Helianthus annuus]|nr:hypothetical protein HanHA89_Chr13g0507371 [Helianthus annuus]